MPRTWYDHHAINQIEDCGKRDFYRSIAADKKPYFMRYIYPALMRQYNTYVKNTNKNALREFQMSVEDLLSIRDEDRTERQNEFLRYYELRMPVGVNPCVMNKICKIFESEFDGFIGRHSSDEDFDYTIMKSGADYAASQKSAIAKIYDEYNRKLKSYAMFAAYERVDSYDRSVQISEMKEDFKRECAIACPDKRALCDIVLDLCYGRSGTKQFAWEISGDQIVLNLLERNGWTVRIPVRAANGKIEFRGETFSMVSEKIGADI